MMTSALKMIADRIALLRARQMHDVERPELRIEGQEDRRDNGEIFRDVVGDRERCQRRRASSTAACQSRPPRSAWSGWNRGRPCCPASRAAWVPVFMQRRRRPCASAGASLVPSPHIATSLALWPARRGHSFQLILGRRLREKNRRRRLRPQSPPPFIGLSAGDHDRCGCPSGAVRQSARGCRP